MISARNFRTDDIAPIDDIFNRQSRFGVPSLNNLIQNATLEDENGKVVGYGCIKLFAEGSLLLDPDESKKVKAESVREAVRLMILFAKDAGLETLYVIGSTENFSQILRNKYGFKAVPGELLMMDLTENGEI